MNAGRGGSIVSSGERWVLETLLPSVASGVTRPVNVLDVGAHRGEFGIMAATRLGASARVVFVEPAAELATSLRTIATGLPDATVVEMGLSDAEEERQLYAEAQGSALASVYDRRLDHFGITVRPVGTARFTTLDLLLTTLGIDRVHLLKLDVEGHEISVLRGGKAAIAAGQIDIIQFEFGGANIDSGTYLRDFWQELSPQYRIYRLLMNGLDELHAYDERDEIFVTSNFVAIRRGVLSGH